MPIRFVAKSHRRRSALLVGLLLASVSMSSSYAFERVGVGARHFFQCFGLMLGNPPSHEDNCLPNRVPGPFGSIQEAGGNDGVVAVPVVVPPVVTPPVVEPPVIVAPPPPPVVEDPTCNCGPCYAI